MPAILLAAVLRGNLYCTSHIFILCIPTVLRGNPGLIVSQQNEYDVIVSQIDDNLSAFAEPGGWQKITAIKHLHVELQNL